MLTTPTLPEERYSHRLKANRVAKNMLHCDDLLAIDALEREFQANQHRWVTASPSEHAQFLERELITEVSLILDLTEFRARALIAQARLIVGHMPHFLTWMRAGEVREYVAWQVTEAAEGLDPSVLPAYDLAVSLGRFDVRDGSIIARARRAAERLRTEPLQKRRVRAYSRRHVSVAMAEDGMAYLTAFIPAVQAKAMQASLLRDALAAQGEGDPRTRQQLMADCLVEAVLHGHERAAGTATVLADPAEPHHALRGIAATVNITVPALSLLGLSDEPAIMEGVGPISIEDARVLAAGAKSWNRILTHPVTGVRLAFDRTTYRVPSDLKRWLEHRDRTCRFPGCTTIAARCDVDHIIAWQHGGPTNHDNLVHLCRKHHRLKHNTTWTLEYLDDDGGTIRWHSPTGLVYDDRPPEEDPPPVIFDINEALYG